MRLIIWLARLLNIAYYHCRGFLDKFGFKTNWSSEVGQYFGISVREAEKRYQGKRLEAARLWNKKNRTTEKQIQSFYQETDYFVYRQTYFHRLKIYLDLAVPLLLKRRGRFCEYGGGVGPFTKFLLPFFPGWKFTIADLDCPVFDFAKWRFRKNRRVTFVTVTPTKLPLKEKYDVITCKQVLEHVSQPLKVIKHLTDHLNPEAWIYLDYIYHPGRENLVKGARQRRQVLGYLSKNLKPIFAIDPDNPEEGYGLYLKP